jgi:hypothetical protein
LNGEGIRYLLIEFLAICPIILMRKHLSFKKWTQALIIFFAAVWIVWILYGFPQYFVEGYFYPTILRTGNPFSLALTLNFGSKIILAMFFISLLDSWHPLSSLAKRVSSLF